MNIIGSLMLVRKFGLLACFTMLSFALATFGSGLAGISTLTDPAPDTVSPSAADAFLPVVLFSCLLSIVFGLAIFRSRWYGWKLILAIFVTFFGLITVMTHSESIAFLGHMIGSGTVAKFFLMGAIFAGLFAPIAVVIMAKLRQPAKDISPVQLPNPAIAGLIWRLAVIGVCYLIIYNVFGYYIAWKNPAVQAFYGGTDEGSFLQHLASVWVSNPWMFPFQFGRGILWALFALPVIKMYAGSRWEVCMTVALLFSVWSTQLLWPNPFLPEVVALTHFIETSTSNFLFGWIVGSVLCLPSVRRPPGVIAQVDHT